MIKEIKVTGKVKKKPRGFIKVDGQKFYLNEIEVEFGLNE